MKFSLNFMLVSACVILFALSGCTSDDSGQALSGVLMGIGQGLSGL